MMPLERPAGADGLVAGRRHVGGRRACRGTPPRSTSTTSRRRSASRPTAGCGSRCCSPAAVERIERIKAGGRWIPASLDLKIALENSRLDQTYNTPALATLFLLDQQLQWMLGRRRPGVRVRGPLPALGRRSSTAGPRRRRTPRRSWPSRPCARPSSARSTSTASSADTVSAVLRANGIVDTESLPQARPQPAAHRHVPRRRPRRRRRPHPLHRPRGGGAGVGRAASALGGAEPGVEVGQDVVDRLQADAEAHEVRATHPW